MKCTGLSLNDKKVSAQFSNPDPGSANYSYLSMDAPEGAFNVGTVYSFTVDAEGEETMDKDKSGMA